MVAPMLPAFRTGRLAAAFPDLLGTLGRELQEGPRRWLSGRFMSPAAVWETDDKLHLEIDVPGVPQEALDVSVHDGKLHVAFERKRTAEDKSYSFDSLSYGKFEQIVRLPDTIDSNSIEAELKLGVLHISFAKLPEVQPKKIEVRVS